MAPLTVVCEGCGDQVDGLIDAATTPAGDGLLMSGGFYLTEDGAVCDACSQEE